MLLDALTTGKPTLLANRATARFRAQLRGWVGELCGHCLVCGIRSAQSPCPECFRDLPWNDHACRLCAGPLALLPGSLCGRCARRPPPCAATFAAFRYAWPVDRLLWEFKFRGRLATGRILALALAEYLEAHLEERPDLLVPVPLHRGRLAERGFDQAGELARRLARALRLDCEPGLLRRVRPTPAQSGLGRAARQRNLRGAFACRGVVSGLHLALVDDVVTTGSTAAAASIALLRAGAARVSVYAVARA